MIKEIAFYLFFCGLMPLQAYVLTFHNDTDFIIKYYVKSEDLKICTGSTTGTIAPHSTGIIDGSKVFKRMGGYVSAAGCCIERIALKAQVAAGQTQPRDYVQGPLLCSDLERHIVISNNALTLQ
jgi:hypothetical protein